MSLPAEITEECRAIAKRREAARTLSSWALTDLEAANRPRSDVPVLVHRDPCPMCAARGDLGCRHRPARAAIPLDDFRFNHASHAHKFRGAGC